MTRDKLPQLVIKILFRNSETVGRAELEHSSVGPACHQIVVHYVTQKLELGDNGDGPAKRDKWGVADDG